jgi:predicted nucleic acid-binding protein
MVVFDTSVVIDAARRKKYALNLIESYAGKERIATTVVTKYEMLRGSAKKQGQEFISQLLDRFVILDFEEETVVECVKAYRSLSEKGKLINELDIIIAGITAANNETLITKDKDFQNLQSNNITVLP